MFKKIKRLPFWLNLLIGIGAVVIITLVFFLSLNWITRHGESMTVPSVIGKNINDVEKFLGDKGFEVVVQDSVYYDSLPPGAVIRQVPEADDVVKINRTVYVTINRFVPPDIAMPNLIGSSYRNAEMILKNLGLRIGDTSFRPDFAKNAILEQLFNGNSIKAGTKLKMGSRIDLVLGAGLGDEQIPVPDLRGLSLEDAIALLDGNGLSVGIPIVDPNVRDTARAFVYRQSIMPKTEDGAQIRIRQGQMIDVWLSVERPNIDSIRKVENAPPPEQQQQDPQQ
jgi:beta-lactam-binding protein with PASTA domain